MAGQLNTWALLLPSARSARAAAQELDTVGDDADQGAVARLRYLTGLSKKTLRIYPVGMLARIVKSPLQLMGYGAGTMLAPCCYLTHQRGLSQSRSGLT